MYISVALKDQLRVVLSSVIPRSAKHFDDFSRTLNLKPYKSYKSFINPFTSSNFQFTWFCLSYFAVFKFSWTPFFIEHLRWLPQRLVIMHLKWQDISDQRQPTELLCERMCSRKFRRKTPLFESLFNKVASFSPATLLNRDSNTDVFLWNLRNLRS